MNDIGLNHRVAISIWKQDEVIGFIWAIEIDKSLTDEDFILVKKACRFG